MFRCVICRFEVELDDIIAPAAGKRCVCLRCFARETHSHLPLPRPLRRDITAALAAMPTRRP